MDSLGYFIKIIEVSSSNANTSKTSSLKNLILGSGLGFDPNPPYDCLSWRSWRTKKTTNNKPYFDQYPDPIIIDFFFEKVQSCDGLGFWSNRVSFSNSVKNFTIQFALDEDGIKFSEPIQKISIERNSHEIEIFSFPKVTTKIVRLSILSNHNKTGLYGNSVALREVVIINNVEDIKKNIKNYQVYGNKNDTRDKEYNIMNIRSEFALDSYWSVNISYKKFLELRGFSFRVKQLRRIDLSRWADKIYTYYFLKEHGVKGMPVIIHSRYLNRIFIEKVENLYNEGLNSFVIKMNHLAYGKGVFRVKDGKFISSNEHDFKTNNLNKKVNFEYLYEQMQLYWNEQQFSEEWACNVLAPGIILEELIDNPVELKFTVVFGEVIGFFVENPGLPTYDEDGNSLKKTSQQLPFWWKEAKEKAKQVANLVRADHIRIDLFYYNGEVIVCEITWNGVEMKEHHESIARKLNNGYNIRANYFNKKDEKC